MNTVILYEDTTARFMESKPETTTSCTFLPTQTQCKYVLRHHIPKLIDKFPGYINDRARTHSIHSYICFDPECYICNNKEYVQKACLCLKSSSTFKKLPFVVIVDLTR